MQIMACLFIKLQAEMAANLGNYVQTGKIKLDIGILTQGTER